MLNALTQSDPDAPARETYDRMRRAARLCGLLTPDFEAQVYHDMLKLQHAKRRENNRKHKRG